MGEMGECEKKTHLASFRCRSRRHRREHICAQLSSSYVGVQIGAQESEWMWMGKKNTAKCDKWAKSGGTQWDTNWEASVTSGEKAYGWVCIRRRD